MCSSDLKPFTPAEQAQLNNLIRNAMGFNAQRGDSLNLLNSAFNEVAKIAVPEIPLWKQPEVVAQAKEGFKYLLLAGAGLFLFFGIIRPAYRNLVASLMPPPAEFNGENVQDDASKKEFVPKKTEVSYESSVQAAKQIAQQQPKIVASVVQEWMNK